MQLASRSAPKKHTLLLQRPLLLFLLPSSSLPLLAFLSLLLLSLLHPTQKKKALRAKPAYPESERMTSKTYRSLTVPVGHCASRACLFYYFMREHPGTDLSPRLPASSYSDYQSQIFAEPAQLHPRSYFSIDKKNPSYDSTGIPGTVSSQLCLMSALVTRMENDTD